VSAETKLVIGALENEHRDLDRKISAARDRQRQICEEIDGLRLSLRPTYPTDMQREGIIEAARRIRDGIRADIHHGDATNQDRSVVVDGARGWLSIRHHAPTSKARRGYNLWLFEDHEIDALLDLVRAEGFEIADNWPHGDGLSIRVVL
jgi:hypothetical protein